jgi:tetratricopeptide (TPR) repeat protein
MRASPVSLSLVVASAWALLTPAHASTPVDDLIKKGDVFYERLQPNEALKYYLPAEKLDQNNVPLLVRIARQYRHLMSEASNQQDKVHFGRTAIEYARRAVALAPDDAEAQLAVAISYGKLLPFLGTKEQFNDSSIIRSSASKAIALDPQNDIAWQIMGRWYLNLAEVGSVKRALAKLAYGALPPATFQDAERCFQKAIELNPNRLMHYIELGRTYAGMGRTTEAKHLINKGLCMSNTEKDDPETKARGRELLAKLQ